MPDLLQTLSMQMDWSEVKEVYWVQVPYDTNWKFTQKKQYLIAEGQLSHTEN